VCERALNEQFDRAFVTYQLGQVRGFKPGRSIRMFQGETSLSTPPFGGEVKPSVPCRRFAACKRSIQWRGNRHCRQNYRSFFTRKIQRLRPGLNPRTWVSEVRMLTSRPLKPLLMTAILTTLSSAQISTYLQLWRRWTLLSGNWRW
jgi:hypothetical protein